MSSYERPGLPYDNESLPNDNRYTLLTTEKKSPPGTYLDADFDYIIDSLNIIDAQLNGIVAGSIPGSSDPVNANKLLTTNGAGVNSWIVAGTESIEDGAITETKLGNTSVTHTKIGHGAVQENNILNDAVTATKISNLSITAAKLAEKTITASKIADTTIIALNIALKTITEAQIADVTITNTKMVDSTLTGAKMAPETVTNRELSRFCTWKPGDLKMSAAQRPSFGFLNCNGQAVSRNTYIDLFNEIGVTFGAGNGNTTFNVPDWRGRVPVGFDYTQAGSVGATGGNVINAGNDPAGHTPYTIAYQSGEQAHALTANENGPHTHSYNNIPVINLNLFGGDRPFNCGIPENAQTGSSGTGAAHNNLQPYGYSIMWIYAGV